MDFDIAKLVLDRGVDVNFCDTDGQTLLHKLCLEGDKNTHNEWRVSRPIVPPPSSEFGGSDICSMLRLVLEHGADVHSRNSCGETPLHAIAQRRNVAEWEIKLLLIHGATTIARDNQGYTALQVANKHRNMRVSTDMCRLMITKYYSVRASLEQNQQITPRPATDSPSRPPQTTSKHQTSFSHQ
jgi:ankyrin repeat protein